MARRDGCRRSGMAAELAGLDEAAMQARMRQLDTDTVIELLNSRRGKVAGFAFDCLVERPDGEAAVIAAILGDRLTRRDAKVMGTNVLTLRGRSHPAAIEAYFHLIDDRNEEVGDNALFGIVFAQCREHIGRLRGMLDRLDRRLWLARQVASAIRALEEDNPFLYSRYYGPECAERVWGVRNATEKSRAANSAIDRQEA